jgi:hypothetical protein
MTDDRDLIQQYLDQLRLSLRIPEVGRILVEAEDAGITSGHRPPHPAALTPGRTRVS